MKLEIRTYGVNQPQFIKNSVNLYLFLVIYVYIVCRLVNIISVVYEVGDTYIRCEPATI